MNRVKRIPELGQPNTMKSDQQDDVLYGSWFIRHNIVVNETMVEHYPTPKRYVRISYRKPLRVLQYLQGR